MTKLTLPEQALLLVSYERRIKTIENAVKALQRDMTAATQRSAEYTVDFDDLFSALAGLKLFCQTFEGPAFRAEDTKQTDIAKAEELMSQPGQHMSLPDALKIAADHRIIPSGMICQESPESPVDNISTAKPVAQEDNQIGGD